MFFWFFPAQVLYRFIKYKLYIYKIQVLIIVHVRIKGWLARPDPPPNPLFVENSKSNSHSVTSKFTENMPCQPFSEKQLTHIQVLKHEYVNGKCCI